MAKTNKNVLQMAFGKVLTVPFGTNRVCLVTPMLNLTKTLWISVRHRTEASRYGVFKRCTELCYTGSAS